MYRKNEPKPMSMLVWLGPLRVRRLLAWRSSVCCVGSRFFVFADFLIYSEVRTGPKDEIINFTCRMCLFFFFFFVASGQKKGKSERTRVNMYILVDKQKINRIMFTYCNIYFGFINDRESVGGGIALL